MKQLTKDILVSAFLGFVLPGMFLCYGAKVRRGIQEPVETAVPVSLPVRIRDLDGTVSEGEMEPYLVGVLLKEMPAFFEEEALKAQAVVARTYARKAWEAGGKHGDGSVCTEPSCCQGYCTEEEYYLQGGREENVEKVRSAVCATAGQVLTYEGKLIEATYFSCSGGRTEDAVAVWGTDFPYLRAVDSPGEEEAAYYRSEMTVPKSEIEQKLGVSLDQGVMDEVIYTEGGGVDTVCIGGTYFTGVEVRSLLGLRSTAFSLEEEGENIVITTKGYGHRVGMSQYGADAMAVAGSTYEEILSHYYPGTALVLSPQIQ